jgi:hypothetical protein
MHPKCPVRPLPACPYLPHACMHASLAGWFLMLRVRPCNISADGAVPLHAPGACADKVWPSDLFLRVLAIELEAPVVVITMRKIKRHHGPDVYLPEVLLYPPTLKVNGVHHYNAFVQCKLGRECKSFAFPTCMFDARTIVLMHDAANTHYWATYIKKAPGLTSQQVLDLARAQCKFNTFTVQFD